MSKAKQNHDDIFERLNDYINKLSYINIVNSTNYMDESMRRDRIYSSIRALTSHLIRKGLTVDAITSNINKGRYNTRSLFRFKDWKKLQEKEY
jgi:hypothetical protein